MALPSGVKRSASQLHEPTQALQSVRGLKRGGREGGSFTHTTGEPDGLKAFCFAIFDNSRSSLAFSLSGPFVSSPAFPETSYKYDDLSKITNDYTNSEIQEAVRSVTPFPREAAH